MKTLAKEKDQLEREKWDLRRQAKEATEHAGILRSQLDLRENRIKELEAELTMVTKAQMYTVTIYFFSSLSLSVHSLPLSLCLCLPLSLSLPHALQPCLSLSLSFVIHFKIQLEFSSSVIHFLWNQGSLD